VYFPIGRVKELDIETFPVELAFGLGTAVWTPFEVDAIRVHHC
jgi:hypothetical protein